MSDLPERTTTNSSPVETNSSIGGKLSSTTLTYIAVLSVMGLFAIGLILYGDFEGKVSRVVSTLLLFAAFTCCSSYHMGRNKQSNRSPVFAQVANIYMLLLSLVLIWGTLSLRDYESVSLVPSTIFIIVLVQVGLLIAQRVSALMEAPQKQLRSAASLATAGISATTILFTLPLGLDDLETFGDGYWRFAIAVILFTGIMLSITGFVLWAFHSDAKKEKLPVNAQPQVQKSLMSEAPQPRQEPAPVFAPASAAQNPYVEQGVPHFAPPVAASMPWPVFPNGQPIPAKSNGRPDFAALQTVANIYAESERQFFG